VTFQLPYGAERIELDVPFGRHLGTLDVADVPAIPDRDRAIRTAIENPIGMDETIFERVRPGETVAIIVSDSFRKTGAHHVLPVLVEGLNRAGIPDEHICITYATGTHRAPTRDEEMQILGPAMYARFHERARAHNPHDPEGVKHVGTTSRGTPVAINRRVAECDRIITTGAAVFHYFAGYGGGRKSILPGIASVETISHNHAMNLDPEEDRINPAVRIGAMDTNPVAADMLEGAKLAGVDCIVNTVLNRRGEIAAIFAGNLEAAHRAATAFAYDMFALHIEERADLVIAASGQTKNYVQTHKALFNAYQAVKPGGRIVLLAPCEEGPGGEQFLKWVRLGSRDAIIAQLRKSSEINGQTALSTIQKAPIALFVTNMTTDHVAMLKGRKVASASEGLALAQEELATAGVTDPTYYVMPSAAYTVPFPATDNPTEAPAAAFDAAAR
jgi:nickel-dependent lactate racemase